MDHGEVMDTEISVLMMSYKFHFFKYTQELCRIMLNPGNFLLKTTGTGWLTEQPANSDKD